jgi:hypothetical protein
MVRSMTDFGSPEQALRPEREHERDQGEGDDDRVLRAAVRAHGGEVGRAEVEDEGVEERSGCCAEDRAHPADDHDNERVQQPLPVLPRGDVGL